MCKKPSWTLKPWTLDGVDAAWFFKSVKSHEVKNVNISLDVCKNTLVDLGALDLEWRGSLKVLKS